MGLKQGLNSIYHQGVYVKDAENALLEYKIFHTDTSEKDHMIITNLRNGKVTGPVILSNKLGLLEAAEVFINNYARDNYPNT